MIVFDTETTGLPKYRDQAHKGSGNWPHLVSIAWIKVENTIIFKKYFIIKPQWSIPVDSTKIHGITVEKAMQKGHDLHKVMKEFMEDCSGQELIAHNMNFDYNVIINAIMWDLNLPYPEFKKLYCTMELSKNLLKIPGQYGYKYPKLLELYEYVTKKPVQKSELHNSLYDTELLAEIVLRSTTIRILIGLPAIPLDTPNEIQSEKRVLYL